MQLQTASMTEKNCFLILSNHVCNCGAVVKELLAPADKAGSTPGDTVFCFIVPFFLFFLVSF